MEAAHQCVQLFHTGEAQGVAGDVDGAGVPAAGEHDEPTVADVHHERLVVEDQRIGFPLVAGEPLVEGHALLEVGGAVDLAGDQHRLVEQQRSLAPLDHLEPLVLQRARRQRGELDGGHVGDREASAAPHHRMHHQWHPGAAAEPGEPFQAARVVEVSVAEHDGFDVARVDAELVHVVGHAVG